MEDELIGILFIDIYKSSLVKLDEDPAKIKATFDGFHKTVDAAFESFGGKRWNSMGDGAIFTFPNSNWAVGAALRLLADLPAFDGSVNRLASSLHVRIGIHEAKRAVEDVPHEGRGVHPGTELDVGGKLEKNCPVGKIAVSEQVYRKLEPVYQTLFRKPAIGSPRSASAFVLERRNPTPRERVLSRGLSDDQIAGLPPIPFREWARLEPAPTSGLRDLQRILEEPFLVVLGESLADTASPVQAAATSDAVGIIEMMAVLRSNPGVITGLDRWTDTADFACDRSIVLVGSGMVNSYAFAFNNVVRPVRFAKVEGRVTDQIIVETTDGRRLYGAHALPPRDCGFVVLFKSPVNPEKHVVWIAGITGMGTQAAGRFAWELVQDPNATLTRRLGSADVNPIACVVAASTASGSTDITSYYRRWRITDYVMLLAVNSKGCVLSLNEAPA